MSVNPRLVFGGFSPEKAMLKIMIIHGRPYLSWPKDHATGLEEKAMRGHPVVGGFSPERGVSKPHDKPMA